MMGNTTTPKVINNRYELLEEHTPGGMGTVYRARDRQTQRELFLKILDGDHPIAPARLHRFKTEFRRTPGLVPANAWEVYDLGLEEHGLLFMTLEVFQPGSSPTSGGAGASDLTEESRREWGGMLARPELLEGDAFERTLAWLIKQAGGERGLVQLVDAEGRTRTVAQVGDPVSLADASRTSIERVRYEREICLIANAGRSSVGLPLQVENELAGLLYVDGPEASFKPEVVKQLSLDLALVVAKDKGLIKAQEESRHLEMLNALSRTVSSTLDLQQILKLVLAQSLEVTEAEQGAVFWGEERLATLNRHGDSVDDLRVSNSVLQQVLSEGKSLSILDTQEDERFATQASIMDLQLRSIMCVPLRAGEATRGVLYVSSQSVNRTFGPQDLEVLEAIAGQVALALQNAQAYTTIRELNFGLEEKVQQRTAELRATQAQLVQTEKMAGLGQMVAGVAHELNNPLNFIYGNLKVLRDYTVGMLSLITLYDKKVDDAQIAKKKDEVDWEYLADDLDKTIESCLKGTIRSQKIVADLKLFTGHDEAELKPVDLRAGIESAIAMVQGRFSGKADFKLELADLPLVNAYGKHLNQAFLAILTNAGQALSEPGDIRVTLRQEGDFAVVEVHDNGAGIPSANLPKIFDPFFTTRPVGEGTGLGLTTAFTIVERHHGTLGASSTPEAGTCFTIRLPLAGVPNPA
jgi:signal transduction histidine kinase